ncbi:hypothetical protein IMSHALPRED_008067 [Imshaugia aleurites]|uniref:TLC domain-containing protein n=1 Tax=Imshaugia aleurites TaxID=172621 RepID=A0A8H3FSL4_9LECA|nr:hypothetical protein IMSHALPRED_008067 [Imshaugia aleurites]
MRDPIPPPRTLINLTNPLARTLSLRTLPLHAHEILPSFTLYTYLHSSLIPFASRHLFPQIYPSLAPRTKTAWNARAVSLLSSCVLNTAALSVIYLDRERWAMGPRGRVWGYTGASGMVQGFAAGYFLWDLAVCAGNVEVHGPGALMHAVSALAVSLLGFRPFCNYYGLNFVLYELSTPFLNVHWFMDKLGMTGSTAQLVNGIALVATFGASRLVWGTYQSVRMYQDMWIAFEAPGGLPVPPWLALAYVVSNTTLSVLNFYWFGRMITTLRKRFEKPSNEDDEKGTKE